MRKSQDANHGAVYSPRLVVSCWVCNELLTTINSHHPNAVLLVIHNFCEYAILLDFNQA